MNGTIVTKKGLHLITKLMAAKKTFIFTRAAVGTGKLLPNYDPSMMLDLIEYKMDGLCGGSFSHISGEFCRN